MYQDSAEYRKIVCKDCGFETFLDENGLCDWLVRHGILKPNHQADDELVYELFHASLSRFSCPECGSSRLNVSVVTDDFSDLEPRRCKGCRRVIPAERVEIFPDAEYCAVCMEKIENDEPLPIQAEYCPICGKMMEPTEVCEGGKTYIQWVCRTIPSCRYRKKK